MSHYIYRPPANRHSSSRPNRILSSLYVNDLPAGSEAARYHEPRSIYPWWGQPIWFRTPGRL
jgi:hypothetical protein